MRINTSKRKKISGKSGKMHPSICKDLEHQYNASLETGQTDGSLSTQATKNRICMQRAGQRSRQAASYEKQK